MDQEYSPRNGEEKQESDSAVHDQKMNSLGYFTQGIVHDIRNALHVVVNSSAMIERRTDDPVILTYLESIDKTIERTNGLIERILCFANNSEEHLGIIDLVNSIDESINLTRPMVPFGIGVEWIQPHEPVQILGDHGQMYQVVLNLLKNAIEAIGRENKGSIFVSLYKVYPWAEIKVRDSGSGIDPDVLEHIFETCFTTKMDGNGFGLANVYAIIEKHGGAMQAVSPEGQGAEFIIQLPLIPELNI